MIPFEFTEGEYDLLRDAVGHAIKDSVSSEAQAGFHNVHHELISQYEEWQDSKNDSTGDSNE